MRHEFKVRYVATPGAGATVTLFDDGIAGLAVPQSAPSFVWLTVAMDLDKDVTIKHLWAPRREAGDADLTVQNNDGSGDLVGARYVHNFRLRPGRNKFTVTAGTPAPTANYIALEGNTFDGSLDVSEALLALAAYLEA